MKELEASTEFADVPDAFLELRRALPRFSVRRL